MREIEDEVWRRRGFAVLWNPAALGVLCRSTQEVISVRELLALKDRWPDLLPTGGGTALVVTGLEGCLDRIEPSDAGSWLEDVIHPTMLSFQRHNHDEAALVFWMPTAEKRVDVVAVDDTISWEYAPPFKKEPFALSQHLFGGAHKDACRIMATDQDDRGHRRSSWIGIHLPRIS